ncbi:glycosyltransferase family 2 protein [Christiangramia sp. OXR-203]|uniref:glycosyltransferase family 2 protein n=1 Tax=Christiangramia sp. OXR-203 TaxID=3100176 RepID=UPI002AC94578|nr:glycosyltransferase family 2 protein [Christiangramia sp. OXR-203]WPY97906.1 glycosyltransferase family 2 protein [Christiangramia sp. OXR-203]
MTSDKPKITILLATFNRAHLIRETLDSIMAQTYTNWECLIVDDHSIDETEEVIGVYLEKDNRFEYYKKKDKYKRGLSGTRNYGLDLAAERNAEFIQFFDDDDIMHPEKLELQIKPLLNNVKINFTVCKFQKIVGNKGEERIINPKLNMHSAHLGDSVLTGDIRINSLCPLFRMNFINNFRFDETLKYAEEWELFVRLGYLFPDSYSVVNKYLFKYRKHYDSLTMGDDKNYDKIKTSAIIRIKIFNFLNSNNLHTKRSIIFFGKNFLISQPRPDLVKALLKQSKKQKFNPFVFFRLRIGLFLHKVYSLLIAKLFQL